MGRTFTITENAVNNLVHSYARQKNECARIEEFFDYNDDILNSHDTYQWSLAYCYATEKWLEAIGISPKSDFVMQIVGE